jgi:hypothetical protein
MHACVAGFARASARPEARRTGDFEPDLFVRHKSNPGYLLAA